MIMVAYSIVYYFFALCLTCCSSNDMPVSKQAQKQWMHTNYEANQMLRRLPEQFY
jgi:hypothetical protein